MMSGPAHSGLDIDSGSVFEQEFYSILKSGIQNSKFISRSAHPQFKVLQSVFYFLM
jgi:hypothetical protein